MIIIPPRKFIRALTAVWMVVTTSGCMLNYLAKSSYSQMKILYKRKDIQKVLSQDNLAPLTKEKLLLIQKVRDYCFNELKLKKTKNYSSYVQLDDKYVSYLLRVSDKYNLKSYQWKFPIVGTFPYLGFFDKNDALAEQKKFIEKNYDTYVRGVTAFSSLGWFNDPILSSMMNYTPQSLVNLIIHETVHSTIFIKDNADFNERMATFLANIGTRLFFMKWEGKNSETLKAIDHEIYDDTLFSKFITQELGELKKWYQVTKNITDPMKEKRLQKINDNFSQHLLPQLKTKRYHYFKSKKLNNANLLPYLTYMSDLSDFERAHNLLGNNFDKTLKYLKSLESSKHPQKDLKNFNL